MQLLFKNKALIKQLIKREIESSYKGTSLGILWLFMKPLFLLSVYAFVFGIIFKTRWPNSSENTFEFAIILFCGLILFNLLSEIFNSAPTLVVRNTNYVKKIIFPIEIIPIVSLGSALFQTLISFLLLILFYLVYFQQLHFTMLLLPVVLFPFLLLTLGISYFLAALGVYIRDISQFMSFIIPGFMFLSPIFYPLSAVPEATKALIHLNPLTFIITQMREVIIWGRLPDWLGLLIYLGIAMVFLFAGYYFFSKTKKGFADVL